MISNETPRTLVPVGSTSRHYEVLRELSSGELATVYLAYRCEDGAADRLVALKRAKNRQRFDSAGALAQEAHLASRVHHANVVSILDVEQVDDSLLLVMDYVEGMPLRELAAAAGTLPTRVVARIVQDACEGLGAIHAATNQSGRKLDLVHRNVAPENVLCGTDGISRLSDFGIAVTNTSTRATRRGIRKGAPQYMAPEYITQALATASTDLYALAVVAFESFTGRSLFPGPNTINEVARLQREELSAPPGVSPGIDAFLLRALGRSSLPRFTDAKELSHSLVMACAGDVASRREVGELVEKLGAARFAERRALQR